MNWEGMDLRVGREQGGYHRDSVFVACKEKSSMDFEWIESLGDTRRAKGTRNKKKHTRITHRRGSESDQQLRKDVRQSHIVIQSGETRNEEILDIG